MRYMAVGISPLRSRFDKHPETFDDTGRNLGMTNIKLFKKCRDLADSLKLQDCSMGMSGDWEEAVKAGSTWLRLGSTIFGNRTY